MLILLTLFWVVLRWPHCATLKLRLTDWYNHIPSTLIINLFSQVAHCLSSFADESHSKSFSKLKEMCRIIDTNVKNELSALNIFPGKMKKEIQSFDYRSVFLRNKDRSKFLTWGLFFVQFFWLLMFSFYLSLMNLIIWLNAIITLLSLGKLPYTILNPSFRVM